MVRDAIILMSEERGTYGPPIRWEPIAGLPLIQRQIFSLWRAGVTTVTIWVPPAAQTELEQHLDQNLNFTRKVRVTSDWDGLLSHLQDGVDNNPRLAVLGNVLPDPQFLAEFVHYPVSPGTLALGVVVPPPSAMEDKCDEYKVPTSYLVTLDKGLVTSLSFSGSKYGRQAMGLVLFSPSVWKDWQRWQRRQSEDRKSSQSNLEVSLFRYIDHQAKENKVLGVECGPFSISTIDDNQDVDKATACLITSTKNSPSAKGFLEDSLNCRLAREILPWVLPFRVTPNQITIADFLLGLVSVLGFASGTYWQSLGAALLLQLVIVLDCLDGWVARLTFQESEQGARLDYYADTILNLLIFWGIAIGQYQASGRPLFLGLGLLLTLGYLVCWQILEPPGSPPRDSSSLSHRESAAMSISGKIFQQAVSRDFFYLILLCAFLDCLDWLIIGIALGTNIFAMFLYVRQHGQN